MKSIEDTLRTVLDIANAFESNMDIAIAGGYAAVLHGVERTTIDVDFCIYSKTIESETTSVFFEQLKKRLPDRFAARLIEGSKIPDDPFGHDVIFLDDSKEEFMRIDLIIAKFKWELEGILKADRVPGIPIPVLPKSYLAAMKLRSSGYKDAADIVALFGIMNDEEKGRTRELAKRIGRDKKLAHLLSYREDEPEDQPNEYL